MDGVQGARPDIRPLTPGGAPSTSGAPAAAGSADGGPSFEALLARERLGLSFSGHARRRIEQRDLNLDGERLQRLERAVDRVEAKGGRDTLVLLDELALIVSVQNHTVVTAMDDASRKEQVFTNIDSVVIAE